MTGIEKPKESLYPVEKTNLRVSAIGFGGAPLGHPLFTPLTDSEAINVVECAFQQGIRLFDTAPSYGYGESERRLGMALRGVPRHEFVLETKLGLLRDGKVERYGLPPGSVRQSLEESLHRLGVDSLDILLIHDPDRNYRDAVNNINLNSLVYERKELLERSV